MAQIMPAQRLDLGRLDGVLKGERVAVVDALPAPLENIVAVSGQPIQNLDRLSSQRNAERVPGLHFTARHPGALLDEIHLLPGQRQHRAHAKSREHGESRGSLQMIGQLALEASKLWARGPAWVA